MKRLTVTQKSQLSEILGNISVAWFSAGVISPVLVKPKSLDDFLTVFGISLTMSVFSGMMSLKLLKG